ncbi:hypothetical protein PILCRDRAFT_817848 [Piloderma croceum F 1598]|uniref:Uncharacterized protein n=1 Tax=Piloderma croceum (strain F 1598) TaxID=765440 RepID=A0A0C3FZ47_PILCF|nr:hypothetical protein PILCRDRAFT_817848 [Piloderma croceum F 1598]
MRFRTRGCQVFALTYWPWISLHTGVSNKQLIKVSDQGLFGHSKTCLSLNSQHPPSLAY